MNYDKVGSLILSLRKEKRMTQKNLAEKMNISDKTISKWERGMGCPDVSLLHELSSVLGINIEKLLMGDLQPNDADSGNIKRTKFYFCPICGNVLTTTGMSDISCCGRKLNALISKEFDASHELQIETVEEDYFITFKHEMNKEHYISFIAYVDCSRILLVKLYPEQSGEVRFPKMYGGKIYCLCNQHGLFAIKA